MNEERMRVLTMLADNKLTVEQANQLLEVLGDPPAATAGRSAEWQSQPPATKPERDPRSDRLAQQLVDLKAVGVNAEFVREMEALGFNDLVPDQLQQLKAVGVNAEFIAEMRDLGMVDLDADQLIALRSRDAGIVTQRSRDQAATSEATAADEA